MSILKDFQIPQNWSGDGIITSLNNSSALEEFIRAATVPVVDLSIWREDIDLPGVAADNAAIGRAGATHFIEAGHQHCAWFALGSNPVSWTRYEAYRDALVAVGLDWLRLDRKRAQDTQYITQVLRDLPKPCAIYTKSDYDAAWILNLCLSADLKAPDEIAILGAYNNTLICENKAIPLSSVRHNLQTIGYEGAAMLDQLMAGKNLKERIRFFPPKGIKIPQSTDMLAISDPVIRELITYLKTDYQRSISTDMLAQRFGISRRSLESRFRAQMHCSIRESIIRIRIQEGKRRLAGGSESIETIAALSGFCHAPHFSNTFKLVVGCSPTQYRRKSPG